MESLEDLSYPEKRLCEKATALNIPINGTFELTPLCNMNCDMCFVRLNADEMHKQGRLRTVDEWLRVANEMKNEGVIFILLTGGEPLLYPDFKKLYLELRKMGMIVTINTNGTLIDEEWADFFAQNLPRRINITLYGTSRDQYTHLCHYSDGYEKALHAIQLLNKRNVPVKMNGSLTAINKENRFELVELAKSMNTYLKIDTYMYPVERERNKPFNQQSRLTPYDAAKEKVEILKQEHSEEEFIEIAKEFISLTEVDSADDTHVHCRAGRSSFAINWQGQMMPCLFLNTLSVPVFEMGFKQAWTQLVSDTYKITLSSKCASCGLRKVCQSCAACALSETGSFDQVPEYMCIYTHETIRLMKRELEEHHEKTI